MCTDEEKAAIIAARDAEWLAWLDSAPGRAGEILQEMQSLESWHDNRPDRPDEL